MKELFCKLEDLEGENALLKAQIANTSKPTPASPASRSGTLGPKLQHQATSPISAPPSSRPLTPVPPPDGGGGDPVPSHTHVAKLQAKVLKLQAERDSAVARCERLRACIDDLWGLDTADSRIAEHPGAATRAGAQPSVLRAILDVPYLHDVT